MLLFFRRLHRLTPLLLVMAIVSLHGILAAQGHLPASNGATNRFEKADAIYGVYGTINFPTNIQPIHNNRIYIMEGQYPESDYTYISLGFRKEAGPQASFTPFYYWRTSSGTYSVDVLPISFFVYETHNYGVEYRYATGRIHFFIDGIDRRNLLASELGWVTVADAAIAGSIVIGGGVPTPIIGSTFSELEWVKRNPNNGNLVRRPWRFNFADIRTGPYTCVSSSDVQFSCNRTF